ncbi:MAG: O-antigen ligase family protein [Actinobacteria bacterium]|nr:O-antigen ligase family protein [Actinomycetota bacterium]
MLGGAAITTYLGFQAGGYFPGSTALVAVGLEIALLLRVGLAKNPFAGFRKRSAVAVGSLALFVVWSLISSGWSHAPGRALLEVNRSLLYLGALVLFGSLVRRDGRLAALAGGVALGSIVVATAALLTRTLPRVFPVPRDVLTDRLSYPLTYWNALGLLAALGILICVGLSAAERVPRVLRVALSAAVPVLATTLLLTFSRGAIAAGLLGLLVICAACRTRTLLATVVTAVPGAAFACHAAYAATALSSHDLTGPAAVSQGRHVALIVAISSIGALLLRAAVSRWDCPPARPRRGTPRSRRMVTAASLVAVLLAGGGAAVALDVPHQVSNEYHGFLVDKPVVPGQLARARLLDAGNHYRIAVWRVAADTWSSKPARGAGAGTFQLQWNLRRHIDFDVVNAHSVYLGTLSDLGAVGLGLLIVCLIALVSAAAVQTTRRRGRRADRAVAAGVLGAAVCWLAHAGLDWDWEMPAVTWWLFAVGGLALARGSRSVPTFKPPSRLGRLVIMLGIAVVALLPAQIGRSQVDLAHAISAFRLGDCNAAVRSALASVSAVAARSEPYEILGYCDARYGLRDLSLTMIQNAINRDPKNWEFHYDMAIVRAAAGLDPRREARIAQSLNPVNPLATGLAAAIRRPDRRVWRAQALAAPLLIPGQQILRLAPTRQ